MQLLRLSIGALAFLLLCGCENKQVQEYARQLALLVKEYQVGVEGRIVTERRLYAEMAQRSAVEAERDVYENLAIERLHQHRLQTAALLEKRMTPSQIHERMRETALAELDKTKALFEQELLLESNYQSGLAKLSLDAKKIEGLNLALKAMQKDASLLAALQDVQAFGGAFQKEFALEQCKALAQESATTANSLTLVKQALSALPSPELRKPEEKAEAEALQKQVDLLSKEAPLIAARLAGSSRFSVSAKKCQ